MTLPYGLTEAALAAAAAESDPESLAAATRLRHAYGSDLAAAATTQVVLRRRARTKFGADADAMFFTREGLEQATRPVVAAARAARLVGAGVQRVVDLGCGIGADSRAFAAAGLDVVAVEADPATAAVARANLAGLPVEVLLGDAVELAPSLLRDRSTAAFCDPARRTAAGRSWRVEDFCPGWDFVTGLLDGRRPATVKLGPGLPHDLVPDTGEAEWVSETGDVVEVALWRLPDSRPGLRRATLLPSGASLTADPAIEALPVSTPGRFLYEPDGAAIRARVLEVLGHPLGLRRLDPRIAYLSGDTEVSSPWLRAYEVLEVLPYGEKRLRAWARESRVGVLEIKLRGIDVDPAQLRRRLRLAGPHAATVVLSPTPAGARVLVVRRIPPV